jgi:Stress responsive A/B Barrel Domain
MSWSAFRTTCLALGFAALGGIMATAITSVSSNITAQDQPAAAPLRHVVLFKFKPETTKEQIDEIVKGFQALPKKIDGITAFEWGTNNSPEGLAEGFTHCFVVSFKDSASRNAYLPHQAHKDFVAILLPRLDKVMAVDYYAQK